MSILYIIAAILLLCLIILMHELGHYLVGRRLGIGVTEFSIGMGPALFSTTKQKKIAGSNETEPIKYALRLIPLGGYCAFVGEDEKSDNPRAMNNQPAWKRFLTVGAGPFMNFAVAFILAVIFLCTGKIANVDEPHTRPVVAGLLENSPAAKAGMLPDDVIIAIDDVALSDDDYGVDDMRAYLDALEEGQSVIVTVQRGLETLKLALTPVRDDETGKVLLGVNLPVKYSAYDCNILTAVPKALELMWDTAKQTVSVLGDLIKTLLTGGRVQEGTVSGVVGVVSTVSGGMQAGFSGGFGDGMYVITFYIMAISLSLGIMNSMPFPALDGGRMLLLIIEMVTGKHLDRKAEGYLNLIGLALLLMLMIVVTFFDVKTLIK